MQQGLFEGVDAWLGGEKGVEVFSQELPIGGEVDGITGLGQAVEHRLHESGVGDL
ncbi:hypothetical protein D3C86_1804260 [compost metagenome]